MDYEMESEEREKLLRMRRMARKLAKNTSHQRLVRKLPQTVVIVPKDKPRRALPVRQTVNKNKRLTYIILLGASLCAYMYDIDQDTLEVMLRTIGQVTHNHLSFLART